MRQFRMLAASMLTASALGITGLAQTTTFIVDAFDPAGTRGYSYSSGQITNVWMNWFGDAFRSVAWDAGSDAGSNPASGSMKITAVLIHIYGSYYAPGLSDTAVLWADKVKFVGPMPVPTNSL